MGTTIRLAALLGVATITATATPALAQSPRTTIGGEQLASRGLVAGTAAGVPAAPKTSASSYVVADATTGQVLAAKDAHGEYLPASTLKTLTSVTLIPKLDPAAQVKPTQKTCDVTGTKVGMTPSMSYSVQDIFHGMLMVSGNDAALAITQAAGGYKKTIDEMNAEARYLQADDTLAASPNGLDVDLGLNVKTQHTSSYDLALIMRQGLNLADFRKYIGTVNYHWPAPATKAQKKKKQQGGYPIYSHVRLLPTESDAYKGFIGGKNGYTIHAQQTFVGAAQRNGHTIIVALMHAPSLWTQAAKLFDWGFAADGKVQQVGTMVSPVAADTGKKSDKSGSAAATVDTSGSTTHTEVLAATGLGVLVLVGLGGGLMLRGRRRSAAALDGGGPVGYVDGGDDFSGGGPRRREHGQPHREIDPYQ